MSWICPWCGIENDTEEPEGRQTEKCRACKKVVPSREGLQKMKDTEAKALRSQWDELDTEICALEVEKDRLEDRIHEIEGASFDREKVRRITKDQAKLPFEGVPT
jgi:DNA repair exonuclease SbcCD ATPase subunit